MGVTNRFRWFGFLLTFLLISRCCMCEDSEEDEGMKAMDNQSIFIPITPLKSIQLPAHYSKHIPPTTDTDEPRDVKIRLLIHQVVDVDVKNELVKLDMELDLHWKDFKIREEIYREHSLRFELKDRNTRYIELDADFLNHIWKPDISFEELAGINETHLLSEKISLTLHLLRPRTGRFQIRTRRTVTLRCEMKFHYYPADIQNCKFNIVSFQHNFNITWCVPNSEQCWVGPVHLLTLNDSNFEFQVSNVEPGYNLTEYVITHPWGDRGPVKRAALTFALQIRTRLSYHMVQTFLPSVLLVSITCLCFLLPSDMVETRIGVAMTTVLTLTAMFASIRESSPKVSYTMAIDIWMVFCIFFVFLALVLFTLVYWMRRRSLNLVREANLGSTTTDSTKPTAFHSRRTKSFKLDMHREGLSDLSSKSIDKFQRMERFSKKFAFFLFASLFLVFMMSYVLWLYLSSPYFNWEPSEMYNQGLELRYTCISQVWSGAGVQSETC